MNVLVTGASGFIGRHLCGELVARGHAVRGAVRSDAGAASLPQAVEPARVESLRADTDWSEALREIECVVHAAGLAHVTGGIPREAFLEANTAATVSLARQASTAGVRRFVFVSSVKVNGDSSGDRCFQPDDPPRPADAYAESKARAESAIFEEHRGRALSIVVVRPPLVYGPGVKANFLRMLRMVARGCPLPLGSVSNRRSLVGIWNLCDLVELCLSSPQAAGKVWLVSDGQDVSTPELLRLVGEAIGRKARVFPVPLALLRAGMRASGLGGELRQLTASLRVDIEATRRELRWSPPVPLEVGLARTATWYRAGDGVRVTSQQSTRSASLPR